MNAEEDKRVQGWVREYTFTLTGLYRWHQSIDSLGQMLSNNAADG